MRGTRDCFTLFYLFGYFPPRVGYGFRAGRYGLYTKLYIHFMKSLLSVISNIRRKKITAFYICIRRLRILFGRLGRNLDNNEVGIPSSLLSFIRRNQQIDRYTGAMAEAILGHLLGAIPAHQL